MKKLSILCFLSILSSFAIAETKATIDLKSCEAPKYPKTSLMNEEAGKVILEFLVSPEGKVINSKVDSSSGFKNLDKAALAALSLCKFKFATKAEQTTTKVDFVWKLD